MTDQFQDDIAEEDDKEFAQMSLPRREMHIEKGVYYVYKNSTEYEKVEASYVSEAIEKSGVKNPSKVVKSEVAHGAVLPPDALRDIKVPEEKTEENAQKEDVNVAEVEKNDITEQDTPEPLASSEGSEDNEVSADPSQVA